MRRTAMYLAAALMFSFAQKAQASVARAVSFDEKVQTAETIVLGECIRKQSALDPTGRWIVTYSTFRVSKTYKGSAPAEVTVVTPGGELDGLHQHTIGVPSFGEGEVNVLFIRNDKIGPTVLYFDQGAYRVTESSIGKAVVAPVESDLVLIDSQTGRASSTREEGVHSLGEFEKRIGQVLRTGPARVDR
jgi:hypothetical protein